MLFRAANAVEMTAVPDQWLFVFGPHLALEIAVVRGATVARWRVFGRLVERGPFAQA